MPKRKDIRKILLIGSGPIVIGQACEFDYSGTQALKALKEEGYEVILVNSNPATIMTDPELSDRVYIEPITVEFLEKIIRSERPDALLPTMGGQTALNITMKLHEEGILQKYNVEILGAHPEVIRKAENRESFKAAMDKIGVESARSFIARSVNDIPQMVKSLGLPVVLRPSFTLGGEGGGIVPTEALLREKLEHALFLSPTKEVLVEESLVGWKEFELEVVRDRKGNVVIVCSIENLDPMGVHTGDSITVAPAQTLTDKEYQNLRNQAIQIITEIGVETGGSNIQFAVNPKNGRVIVIEMNPRVSRSSALASKATGFPIARVAAKLAVGYTLDELTNDITKTTPCSFEPSIDYVVTKIPRFDFEKFSPTDPFLGTQMKSVGEVMAMGQTFEESFLKALSSIERKDFWLKPLSEDPKEIFWHNIENPHVYRIFAVVDALRKGISLELLSQKSGIDPWFLGRFQKILKVESKLKESSWPLSKELFLLAKKTGWSDRALSQLLSVPENDVRKCREDYKIFTSFKMVDTCAAEFEAKTPYLYSSYSGEDESKPSSRPKVMVLGGGPNRIGQGIEFDYCCVHAALSLKACGVDTVMVNCNPETVSTDFDISDKLYFEPLTIEHVLNIARIEKPLGVIVQFGGQTPLKLAQGLEQAGIKILGTSVESIYLAEDRKKCERMVRELEPLGLKQAPSETALGRVEALEKAVKLGFPLLVRPSFVLGGRAMRIIYSQEELMEWVDEALEVSDHHPILLDRFLSRAIEVDVDALSDGKETFIGGLMEHIEEAGIHSGDSSCSLPPVTLSVQICDRIRTYTKELAKKLNVIGLMNAQFAVQGNDIYLLEVNPRASRTVPFISKATGYPLAKLAVQVMMGKSLHDLNIKKDMDLDLTTYNVKSPVFPFDRFPGVDIILGPEMKSTGEVMGRGLSFSAAFAKAMQAVKMPLPKNGKVFLSIRDEDKAEALVIAKDLAELGFELWATSGTADFFSRHSLEVKKINKVTEGSPHCVEAIESREFALVINTSSTAQSIRDSFTMRRSVIENKIPYSTVISSARAMVQAIREEKGGSLEVLPL